MEKNIYKYIIISFSQLSALHLVWFSVFAFIINKKVPVFYIGVSNLQSGYQWNIHYKNIQSTFSWSEKKKLDS